MPILEYECRECGKQFEFLRLHSSPAAECPACSGKDLEQMISLCAVSSDTSKEANLDAAHRKAATKRSEKQRQQHDDVHRHFEDGVHP